MKKFIYSLTVLLLFSVGISNVSGKEVEKTCNYYFDDSLSGYSVMATVKIYNDNSADSTITQWNRQSVKNNESIKNWKDIKEQYASTSKCPDYALVKNSWGYGVWLSYDEGTLKDIISSKGYASKEAHIATSNEYEAPSDVAQTYYNHVVELTNHIEDVYGNYTLQNCIDPDKVITRIGKCNDIYDALVIYMNSAESEVNSFIKSGFISKEDSRTIKFFNVLQAAKSKWVDVKKELDKEDEKIKQELGLIGGDDDDNWNSSMDATNGETIKIVKKIYNILKILIPVLIVLLSTADFLKVVLLSDEKDYKNAWSRFVKRIVIGIIFFVVPVIVSFILKYSGIDIQQSFLQIFV